MDSMPYAGRSETSPLDPEAFVTDSAAGGTAIATGVKTFNGAVGIAPEENPVPTVLEQATKAGKTTGLVSNSQVTDSEILREHPNFRRTSRLASSCIIPTIRSTMSPFCLLGTSLLRFAPAPLRRSPLSSRK